MFLADCEIIWLTCLALSHWCLDNKTATSDVTKGADAEER